MFIFSTQPIGCWFLIVICPPDLLGRESPMIIRAGCVPARGDFMCSFLVRPEVSGLVFNCHMPACRHAGNAQKSFVFGCAGVHGHFIQQNYYFFPLFEGPHLDIASYSPIFGQTNCYVTSY
jgi:hypothetical protein